MKNLASAALPAEVVADIGEQMREIKAEISTLKETEPPKDFIVDQVRAWLEALKSNSDEKAVRLLVERVDIEQKQKTEFRVTSTLSSVLSEIGCGDRI